MNYLDVGEAQRATTMPLIDCIHSRFESRAVSFLMVSLISDPLHLCGKSIRERCL